MLARSLARPEADLALDLGTASTRLAAPGFGLVVDEPSVVAVAAPAHRLLAGGSAVGHLAHQMLGRAPDSIRVVRPIRDGVIADFDLCEVMLRHFLRKLRCRRRWRRPSVLVGVAGQSTPVERRAVVNSLQRAGAGQVLLVSQLKAAALGAGLPMAEPAPSVLCCLGGGMTQVAVLSLGDIVTQQTIRIGGDALDQAIAHEVRRQHRLRIGAAEAERLRVAIGCATTAGDLCRAEVRGLDAATGLPRRVEVTGAQVRAALEHPLGLIAETIRATVDDCGPAMAADLIDQGVTLVGGGALLAGLAEFLAAQTGLMARVASGASTAVIDGALECLSDLRTWRTCLEVADDDL